MDPVELVREEAGYEKSVLVDVWKWNGVYHARAAFSAHPVNDVQVEKASNKNEAEQLARAWLERLRGFGWKDALTEEEEARIAARIAGDKARAEAEKQAINARIAAFPVSAIDRRLAAAIAAPSDVIELDLTGNPNDRLTVVPPSIGKLTKLQKLVLAGNELTTLPQETEKLKELRYLSAANNRLTSMRPFCYLRKLRVLNLHGNAIADSYTGHHQKDLEVQIAGNPIKGLGFFRGIAILAIDTERLFPIDDRVDKGERLRTLQLYGREPTEAERAEAQRVFPKATIEVIGPVSAGPRILTVLEPGPVEAPRKKPAAKAKAKPTAKTKTKTKAKPKAKKPVARRA